MAGDHANFGSVKYYEKTSKGKTESNINGNYNNNQNYVKIKKTE